MPRVSQKALEQVARDIEPYIDDVIDRDGQLSRESIKRLSKEHAEHTISSERSCRIIDKYLRQ